MAEKVEVEVYYSACNSQSRSFFMEQLIPVYRNLHEQIHLNLIPYGVANAGVSIEQDCYNSWFKEKVCDGNRVHACVIPKYFNDGAIGESDHFEGKNQTLSYLYCMFKNTEDFDNVERAKRCGIEFDLINEDKVIECASHSKGQQLLAEMRDKTLTLKQTMEHAPWIVINQQRSSLAESNLKKSICDAILDEKPNYCSEVTTAKVKLQFHYSSLDSNSANYFIGELYPQYRSFEESIDLDVIPFGLTVILPQEDGSYTLMCPNGDNDCRGNQIHACIYSQYFHTDDPFNEYDGKLQYMNFLTCYYYNAYYPSNNIIAAQLCIEYIFGDVWSTISECVNTKMAIQLLLDFQVNKVANLVPPLTNVPWITVNGQHSSTSIKHHIKQKVSVHKEKPQDYVPNPSNEKPMVYIHYEPLDANSKDFFATGLMPNQISSIAQVILVPYGQSTFNATVKKCVNDPYNCYTYKQHACVLDLYMQSYPVQTLNTIACTFGDMINDLTVVNQCVDQYLGWEIPDPWNNIQACTLDIGDALMEGNAVLVQTLNPKISHVPWVLINGIYSHKAVANLVKEVCEVYSQNDKPALCLAILSNGQLLN